MIEVIDSHTAGEPTRVVIKGGPDLGTGPLSERVARFKSAHDHIRQSIVLEPRGSDAMVGALLCEPTEPSCITGVIFFNNTGYLGMCGHGLIGVAATLNYLKGIPAGVHKVETPVGIVEFEMHASNKVTICNVPSYCYKKDVTIFDDQLGELRGDVCWGGNWFFLANTPSISLRRKNIRELENAAKRVKECLNRQNITGANGEEIDHIEFFDVPELPTSDSRNFVLCPGDAYDRSPCGTGTSAKLASLAARGQLEPDVPWVQESIIGSVFTASYQDLGDGYILPSISGSAYICGSTQLVRQSNDPFVNGIA